MPLPVAHVVKARELSDESLEQAVTTGVQGGRTRGDPAVPLPVVLLGEGGADGVECRDPLVEHWDFGVAAEELLKVAPGHSGCPLSGEDRLTRQDRLMQAGEHRLAIGIADTVICDLELLGGGEVGEGEVQDGDEHREVDVLVGVGANVEGTLRRWGGGAEVGELLGGHPRGHPLDLSLVRCNKPRTLNHWGQGAQNRVRPPLPTHGCLLVMGPWPVIP